MDRFTLHTVIEDQQLIQAPTPFVERESYQAFEELAQSPLILIISGIRRCGKSTLLQKIRHQASEDDFYLNFDDDRLAAFTLEDFQMLLEIFIEKYGQQKTCYFDEIQNIDGWERFIRRLHDQGYKIYLTGSNASMLSQELGTRLTGRYISKTLYPFSFAEYLNYTGETTQTNNSTQRTAVLAQQFSAYLSNGSFPEYIKNPHSEYLHDLYNSIIHRDILVRYKIPQQQAFKQLVYYLASNLAKQTTYNSLKKLVGLSNSQTVSDYCSYLQNAFLCFVVNRYSHSLKRQYGYAKKIYFIDTALAQTVGFRMSEDRGRLLENLVYIALRRQYQNIFFHDETTECDFIIQENHTITRAIQVCYSMESDKTRQQEIAGLLDAMETYQLSEGLILTEHEHAQLEETGKNGAVYKITVMPISKWLLS